MNRILLLFLSVLTIGFSAQSTDYYVSNAGSDLNDGMSPGTAFATLQYAADQVGPGDNVFVADGFYMGFDLRTGGTAGSYITFKASGSNVVIDLPCPTDDGINVEGADYVIIDGFRVQDQPRNGIRLVLSDHCIVRNCHCNSNFERGIFTGFTDDILIEYNVCSNSIDEHGIYISNSSDRSIVRYNECYGNNNIGIHMNGDLSQGGDGIMSDPEIYGNYIHDNNLAAGINLDGVENPVIYNNIIVNNHFSQGIALFKGDGAIVTQGAKIYNNTIIVPDDGRWGILVRDGANANTEIYNNIIINLHDWRGSITCESTNNFSSDYNILINSMSNQGDGTSISLAAWQMLGLDLNSQLADPLGDIFTDHTNDDYSLKVESQAIDAGFGDPVSDIVTVDFDLNPRPGGEEYDIGAFEYVFEYHSIKYLVQQSDITLEYNDLLGIVIIDGNLSGYSVKILDESDQVLLDLTGMPSPIEHTLSSLNAEYQFLEIENTQNASLIVRTQIKP